MTIIVIRREEKITTYDNNTKNMKKNLDTIILFAFFMGVFTILMYSVHTDMQAHIKHIVDINNNEKSYPPNFAFYWLVNILSGFSDKYMRPVTILLMSVVSVIKYIVSKRIIAELNPSVFFEQSHSRILNLIAISLFFCFAIPDPYSFLILNKMYLGRFAPIVWHNSTTIMLFPFAILLFWRQLKVFESVDNLKIRDVIILNVLVFLNIVIKPSFIFVYAPVTLLFILKNTTKYSIRKTLLILTPIVTAAIIIALQYFLIYILQIGSIQEERSSIALSYPFTVISTWIPKWYVPISLLLSFTLPIYTMIFYKEIFKFKPFIYSLHLTITGIIISAIIIEEGPRMYHGNFGWQNVICSYLLFLSTLSFLAPKFISANSRSKKDIIALVILTLHVLSGILYLTKIISTKSFS